MRKKALAPSRVTHVDPKGTKFMQIVAAAYDKAGLSQEEAQRVNDTSGLADLINRHIAENRAPNKFKDEEVDSSYGYLSGYEPKELAKQCSLLCKMFPGLGWNLDHLENGTVPLPEGAEGWFAIPNWMKHPEIFGKNYSEAVNKVLNLIQETRDGRFYNYRDGEVDEKHLRQTARTKKFFAELSQAQGNPDILIVPAQFGIRHRGRSVRRVREVFLANEFGLGAFAVGIMLMTHPERLQNYNDLWVDCAGDEWSPSADGDFSRSPCFRFVGSLVWFATYYVSHAHAYYGSASGFSPQQQ